MTPSTTPATTPAAPPTAPATAPAIPPALSVTSLARFMTLWAAERALAGAFLTIARARPAAFATRAIVPLRDEAIVRFDFELLEADFFVVDFFAVVFALDLPARAPPPPRFAVGLDLLARAFFFIDDFAMGPP